MTGGVRVVKRERHIRPEDEGSSIFFEQSSKNVPLEFHTNIPKHQMCSHDDGKLFVKQNVFFWFLTVLLGMLVLCVAKFTLPKPSVLLTGDISLNQFSPEIFLTNKYYRGRKHPGVRYNWLQDVLFTEPYLPTTFSVTPIIGMTAYHYHWKARPLRHDVKKHGRSLDWQGEAQRQYEPEGFSLGEGLSVEAKLPEGWFLVTVSVVKLQWPSWSVRLRVGREVVWSETQEVAVKYVRRDIQSLQEGDRREVLDAMALLWKVPDEEGRALYGDGFVSVQSLLRTHQARSGDPLCDHTTGGPGFFPHHSSLAHLFEKSLQAVNPKLALPYWDYSRDITEWQRKDPATRGSFTGDRGIFSVKYFGATDPATYRISNGRWKKLQVPAVDELVTSADYDNPGWDPDNHMHNFMRIARSPWSNNLDPHVQRCPTTCGAPPSLPLSLQVDAAAAPDHTTTCRLLRRALDQTTWKGLSQAMEWASFGILRPLLGGTMHCGAVFDRLQRQFLGENGRTRANADLVRGLKARAADLHLDLWHRGLLDCSSSAKCQCPNMKDWLHDPDFVSRVMKGFNAVMAASADPREPRDTRTVHLERFSASFQRALVRAICEGGLTVGDHMQASAPFTPEFWVIQSFVDRFFQFKQSQHPLSDYSWQETQQGEYRDRCSGHSATDLVLGGQSSTSSDMRYMSNVEYTFGVLNPLRDDLPYIYDHFEFDACQKAGHNIIVGSN